jgi:probable HAF family extracellular repeat protein
LGGPASVAFNVNNIGEAVGASRSPSLLILEDRAFITTAAGPMMDLGLGDGANALDINDQSVVAGAVWDGSTTFDPFVWSAATGAQLLPRLNPTGYSVAYGINNQGQVVGRGQATNGEVHAILWEGGAPRDLGTLGGTFAWGWEVNEAAQVAGWGSLASGALRAFLWSEQAGMQDLGAPAGGRSFAYDLNDAGQAAGAELDAAGRSFPVVWDPGQPARRLPVPSGWSGTARGINNRGDVVGQVFDPSLTQRSARLWTAGGDVVDLGAAAGTVFSSAWAISDLGHVVGDAGATQLGQTATLWIVDLPDPDPATATSTLSTAVANLVAAGVLGSGMAKGLQAVIDLASEAIAAGRTGQANGLLSAFLRRVDALVRSGALNAAQAQILIDTAQGAIAQL